MQAKLCMWAIGASLALSAGTLGAQETSQNAGVQSVTEGDRSSLLTLKLRDRDLREVVASIRRKASFNIIMDEGIEETVTIDLEDVPWREALNLVVERAGCIVVDDGGNVLKVEKPPRVYFAFENADIQKVIDTIAKISGANIVVSPEVRGPITLRLKDIPWRDALDAAVKTLGFVVVEEERGILRVVPASNIEQDLVTRTFQLRYVRPRSSYVPFIQSQYIRDLSNQGGGGAAAGAGAGTLTQSFPLTQVLERALTEGLGRIEYFDDINTILVKDTRPVVDEIGRIIQKVDVQPAQVLLNVQFVTTTNEDILDYGISPGGNGYTASLGLGAIPTRLPFDLGPGGFDDDIIANDSGVGPFTTSALNPSDQAITIPNIIFGALDFTQVTATLRLLQKDSSSEIEQAPQIVALDHHPATIFVGEAVRYAQARVEQGQAGGLLLALEEGDDSPVNVGFQLLAIPHIVPGTDQVILDVIPQRTSLTGTGATNLAPAGFDVFTVGTGNNESGQIALPRVSSSTIATKVLLHSGYTAVLGGLKSRTQTETVTQIPVLGDIPFLGYLFKNRVTNDTRTNLLVFITPSIIRSAKDTKENFDRLLRERMELQRAMREQRSAIFGGEDKK